MLLATRELGGGFPVLLLHGLFGRGRNLGGLQRALAAGHRVIACDLRNHGDSAHAWGMGYAALAADVVETLDAAGVERCVVFGHSMGGKVAMRLALDWPERVAGLAVGDIAPVAYCGGSTAGYAAAMRGLALTPGLTRAAADAGLAGAVGSAEIRGWLLQNLAFGAVPAWRIGLEEIVAGMGEILGWDGGGVFGGSAVFVAGGRSEYGVAADAGAIVAQFPAARIVVLPEAGHWVHVDDLPGLTREVQGLALRGPSRRR